MLPDPEIESASLASSSWSDGFFTTSASWEAPGGSDRKESACRSGDQVQSLSQEDPLVKGMATHSSILAWRTP